MGLKILGGGIAAILVGALSFYGGVNYQTARYDNLCLDLGGVVIPTIILFALWLLMQRRPYGWGPYRSPQRIYPSFRPTGQPTGRFRFI